MWISYIRFIVFAEEKIRKILKFHNLRWNSHRALRGIVRNKHWSLPLRERRTVRCIGMCFLWILTDIFIISLITCWSDRYTYLSENHTDLLYILWMFFEWRWMFSIIISWLCWLKVIFYFVSLLFILRLDL